jgi:twitching motility protein PilT
VAALDELFRSMIASGASDLHLLEGQPPKIRLHGHVEPLEGQPPLTRARLVSLLQEVSPDWGWERFLASGDLDFAYAMGAEARFRANLYRAAAGLGAVFRTIPTTIKSLAQLGAPPVLGTFADLRMGLVLVTGPTGSGKSTTLAAVLNEVNERHEKKIITIEDPVEFVHPHKRSVFVQRQVGEDTASFGAALRAVGREDCDVLLVGEMRDLETIALALSAAEMGVLVFGTLHTNSAAKTIDRIVNVFPANQQGQVRSMLSTSLRAIVSQQLLRKRDGSGRVAAHEVLLNNAASAAAIRQGQVAKVNHAIQSGGREGMQTMDDTLWRLVEQRTISGASAYMKAFDKPRFAALRGDEDDSS